MKVNIRYEELPRSLLDRSELGLRVTGWFVDPILETLYFFKGLPRAVQVFIYYQDGSTTFIESVDCTEKCFDTLLIPFRGTLEVRG